ncbi:uncharacterized protein EI90DRAFT_3014413 [Cantharellus anzutake]|uniref:uncharacterized protein n=1 Tax=Cantharellus anzutake TaxID=1750568 RepID=UPI0019057A8B|nr:uncharacterized protein EI90DRAFT_3014413 [Cantharellus anzutake]KAF8335784.1 hypothetical protein EI90DRAFT_3014413 [Cantharellus anzutake]
MRFWNAFVPIALVPVVAAHFHYGSIVCFSYLLARYTALYGVIVPSNNDTCEAAMSLLVSKPKLSLHDPLAEGTLPLCGVNVTWTPHTKTWNSSDGGGGVCSALSGGPKAHPCTFTDPYFDHCTYGDMGYCSSPVCAPPGSGEAQ